MIIRVMYKKSYIFFGVIFLPKKCSVAISLLNPTIFQGPFNKTAQLINIFVEKKVLDTVTLVLSRLLVKHW